MKILIFIIALFTVSKFSFAQNADNSSSNITIGGPPSKPILYLFIYRSDTLQVYAKTLNENVFTDRIKKMNIIKPQDVPKEFGHQGQNGIIAITYKENSPTNILDSLRIYNTASR